MAVLTTDALAISAAVESEYTEVLQRPRLARFLDAAVADEVLQLVLSFATRFVPVVPVHDCRDAKDNK